MRKLIVLTCALLLSVLHGFAQTDKEKANKLLREAIRIIDKGEIDASMLLLDSAHKLDPDNFVYDYERGFASQLKKDYKGAIRYLEAAIRYDNATDQCYQMLGNNYDHDGDPEKAIAAYSKGLKKFPNSGRLYVELGVLAYGQKEYDKAVELWEKGITVHPEYASNYYQLAKLYLWTTDRIWSLFYGEMFLIMEPGTARSQEISKVLFDSYKMSIDLTSDTSSKVDFARPMVISNFDPSKKFKFPFDQVFGLDFIVGIIPMTIAGKKEVDIEYLYTARSGFLNRWYDQDRNKEYNNIVIEFQKKVKDAGHFEAYTYWLLMSGNEKEFETWYAGNEQKIKDFADWYMKNIPKVNPKNYFLRTTIDK